MGGIPGHSVPFQWFLLLDYVVSDLSYLLSITSPGDIVQLIGNWIIFLTV